MGGHGHYGSGPVSGKYIFRNPYRDLLSGHGVDSIGTGEHSRDAPGLRQPLALGLPPYRLHIFLDFRPAGIGSKAVYKFALGGEHHEGHPEHGIGPGREYNHGKVASVTDRIEHHFRSLRTPYPVALHLLERIGPVERVERTQQPLVIGRHTELPLGHLLLLYGETSPDAQTVLDLVVGKHGSEPLAPVHRSLALIGYPVAHQYVGAAPFVRRGPLIGAHTVIPLGLELRDQFRYGAGLVLFGIVPAVEHLEERPLRPLVELRVARAHFPVPVIAEAYPVELFAVSGYVALRGYLGMLPGLYRVLLSRKSECVEAHRMQDIEALEALVACEYVACYVSQRMSHMQTCSRRVREHVQDIELGTGLVFSDLELAVFGPICLPFALYGLEIVFHMIISFFQV